MSKLVTVRDLLVHELKDLYSAETQLTKALPKMSKAASSEELKQAFSDHLAETETHVTRLEKIMTQLDESPRGKKCKAMEGLVAEGKETIQEDAEPAIKDLALIVAAQKVEHYEIAGYGSARTLAELVGLDRIAAMIQETLDEEGQADQLLTQIAQQILVEDAVAAK